jgi:hypothetical protein
VTRDVYDSEDNHVLVRDVLDAFSDTGKIRTCTNTKEGHVGDTEKTNESWLLFQTVVWSTK